MTTTQTDEIKTWQQRLEETCPALGPMHIHACVEEVNDAMQAEIAELRSALQEQAREGEAVANSAILARGRFHAFKGEDAEPDDWEWFEEGTNCEHGCIDAVIVRADAIAAPQPAQPEQGELAGPDQIEKIVDRYVDEYEFTDGENAYHSPNEFEQMLIKDAFYGLLVDEEWDAAWGAHIASLQSAQPVAQPNIQNQIVKDISRHEPCHTCAHYQQGKLPGVRIHDETCYECRSYWGNKWEAA